jgi:hypothetical protein
MDESEGATTVVIGGMDSGGEDVEAAIPGVSEEALEGVSGLLVSVSDGGLLATGDDSDRGETGLAGGDGLSADDAAGGD